MRKLVLLSLLTALIAAGSAFAYQALPSGGQVNDDTSSGIDKTQGVSGLEPANSDVVGGSLSAGGAAVPWAIFRQKEPSGATDQVFVRSFAGGAWTTRGSGTVGSNSDSVRTFAGSLNFDPAHQDGEAPSIDFAGTGRATPWATWYENTTGALFGNNDIFASRFDSTSGKWIFSGQTRGLGGSNNVPVPSLNIHTAQDAENPSVAGGSAADPTKPGPWIAWQETDTTKRQIFVERSLGPGMTNCNGVTPAATVPGAAPLGGFCWQEVGLARVGVGPADSSLNVDPARDGVEPDIAFTGTSDAVPWVVWYEENAGTAGLHSNEMVFAAKAVTDITATGGFHWVAVGNQLQGTLDTSGANSIGTCGADSTKEGQCSLNHDPSALAEDPQVAAGTMDPSASTVPWVVWDEAVGASTQVFVSRLVGSGSSAHFEIANGGSPISTGSADSARPDITFSGNTPYVSWREDAGAGAEKAFLGHFTGSASAPTFVLDESDVPLSTTAAADVREPISSACTANPFNQDGAACQGGALGTPFFLYTNGATPLGLFAGAYQPGTPVTGSPTAVTTSGGTINGSVDPMGGSVQVHFDYGPTTAYGQSTTAQATGPADGATAFSAPMTGLASGTTIHYRAVAVSGFGTFTGADQTLTTLVPTPTPKPTPKPTPPPGPGKVKLGPFRVSGTSVSVRTSCTGNAHDTCKLRFAMTVTETFRGHKLLAITARARKIRRVFGVGGTTVTLRAGQTKTVRFSLSKTGKLLLSKHHPLHVRLRVTQRLNARTTKVVHTQVLTFRLPRKRHARPHVPPSRANDVLARELGTIF